jgi:hypothetical protein
MARERDRENRYEIMLVVRAIGGIFYVEVAQEQSVLTR